MGLRVSCSEIPVIQKIRSLVCPLRFRVDPANYEFSYEVQDAVAGLDFGHHETRKDSEATGTYHVLLPDGRTQIVDYVADDAGYRPMVRYEGTATYPAPGSSPGASTNEGYRY